MSLQVKFWQVKHPWKSGDFVMLKKRTRGMYTFDMLADDISIIATLPAPMWLVLLLR